jgi:hypothetical protein
LWAGPNSIETTPALRIPPTRRPAIDKKIHKLFHRLSRMDEMQWFGETCAVSLSVELPRALAAEVEEVQRRDPEMLRRILMYGMTRRAIYETLATTAAER